jgi:purine-cytosine permease-like protein
MAHLAFGLAYLQDYGEAGDRGGMIAAIFGAGMLIVWLVVMVVMVASLWKIFTKAGEPGWAAIVPIYNILVLLKITGKPTWWIVLYIVCAPIAAILVTLALAEKFGKSVGYAIGMIVLPIVFLPMLAFGSAEYKG